MFLCFCLFVWFGFLFYWIFYLFTFQMLSPFLISPPETPYPISPIPASIRVCPQLSTHSYLPTLTLGHQAFTEPGNSSPIDARQGHPLLHISLVP